MVPIPNDDINEIIRMYTPAGWRASGQGQNIEAIRTIPYIIDLLPLPRDPQWAISASYNGFDGYYLRGNGAQDTVLFRSAGAGQTEFVVNASPGCYEAAMGIAQMLIGLAEEGKLELYTAISIG